MTAYAVRPYSHYHPRAATRPVVVAASKRDAVEIAKKLNSCPFCVIGCENNRLGQCYKVSRTRLPITEKTTA